MGRALTVRAVGGCLAESVNLVVYGGNVSYDIESHKWKFLGPSSECFFIYELVS